MGHSALQVFMQDWGYTEFHREDGTSASTNRFEVIMYDGHYIL
jgi:hypothetical protein